MFIQQPGPRPPGPEVARTPPINAQRTEPQPSQFESPAFDWNTHLSDVGSSSGPSRERDPALDPSNSSSGQVAPSVTSVPERATPQWQKDLPKGFLRGDECFRDRYGDGGSLLDEDNLVSTRFTRNAKACHPRLRRDAEGLAVCMQTRNYAVADVMKARALLADGETALRGEQTRFELTKAAAQRNAVPLDEAVVKAHEDACAELTRRQDAAKELCDKEALDLEEIQTSLVHMHERVKSRTALSDEALNLESDVAADPEIDADEGDDNDDDMNPALVEERGVLALTLAGGAFGGVATAVVRQMYFNISLALAQAGMDRSPEMQAHLLEQEALAMDRTRVARDLVNGFFVVGALFFVLKKTNRL